MVSPSRPSVLRFGAGLFLATLLTLIPLRGQADIRFLEYGEVLPLLWSTMIAIDQANDSENYSVLIGIAAPDFQKTNAEADLRAMFEELREARISLRQTLLMKPKFEIEPQIRESGLLRMRGEFDLNPVTLKFDLLYQRIYGEWRMIGVAVVTGELNNKKIAEEWFRKRRW